MTRVTDVSWPMSSKCWPCPINIIWWLSVPGAGDAHCAQFLSFMRIHSLAQIQILIFIDHWYSSSYLSCHVILLKAWALKNKQGFDFHDLDHRADKIVVVVGRVPCSQSFLVSCSLVPSYIYCVIAEQEQLALIGAVKTKLPLAQHVWIYSTRSSKSDRVPPLAKNITKPPNDK